MILDLIDIEKVKRAVLYSVVMVAVLTFQEIIISRFPLFGVLAFIVPIFPIAIGVIEGAMWGISFGLACGLFTDAMLADTVTLFTMLCPVVAFLGAMADKFLISPKVTSFLFIGTLGLIFVAFFQSLRMFLLFEAGVAALFRVSGLQVLYSIPYVIPIYLICKKIGKTSID